MQNLRNSWKAESLNLRSRINLIPAPKKEFHTLTLYFGSAAAILAVALHFYFPVLKPEALAAGVLYIFLSLKAYGLISKETLSKTRTRLLLLAALLFKFPLLLCLLYLLSRMGEAYLGAALVGILSFLPAAVTLMIDQRD